MRNAIEMGYSNAIEEQETQPLPVIQRVYVYGGLLTLRQLRERCGLSQVQLARAAGVRPIVVDWCERGRGARPAEAARILAALARSLNALPTCTTPATSWLRERGRG